MSNTIDLPNGWTDHKVEQVRQRWNIPSDYYPIVKEGKCAGWRSYAVAPANLHKFKN